MASSQSICRNVAAGLSSRRIVKEFHPVARLFSSVSSKLKMDPAKLVVGLTREKVESDPEILSFLEANFPNAFEDKQFDGMGSFGSTPMSSHVETVAAKELKKAAEIYPRNIRPLVTYLRDPVNEEGSRKCYKLRKFAKMVPGLVYGGDPRNGIFSHKRESKIMIKTPVRNLQREVDRFDKAFESRVYDLRVLESPDDDSGGTVYRVTPQNLQKHPVQDTIYFCANFCRYHPERILRIPIVYINEEESPVIKRDGYIIPLNRFVECVVEDGADIPEMIELECTGLGYKEVIFTDRLIIPDGVTLSKNVIDKGRDFLIGVVYGKSRSDAALEEEEAAAEEAKKKG